MRDITDDELKIFLEVSDKLENNLKQNPHHNHLILLFLFLGFIVFLILILKNKKEVKEYDDNGVCYYKTL